MVDQTVVGIHIDFEPGKPDSVERISKIRTESRLDYTPEQLARNLRMDAHYHPGRNFSSDMGFDDVIVTDKNGKLIFAGTSPEAEQALLDLPRF